MVELLVALAAVVLAPVSGEVRLIGVARIEPDRTDLSGLTEPCGPVPHDRLGGWGSAIEWTGKGDRYIVLPDRGPRDGAEEYRCRFHEVEIRVEDEGSRRASMTVTGTTLLRAGKYGLVGLSNVYDASDASESLRFDPEGARLVGGELYVADEYGPLVCAFGLDGARRRVVPVPAKFGIARPDGKALDEDRQNGSGRVANRGFEGLAVTPDGKSLWALPQSPLIQDGGREGCNIRLLRLGIDGGGPVEVVYPLDHVALGCSEILAVEGTRFLTIERESADGIICGYKRIVLIDAEGATDVSAVESLPRRGLPEGVRPVTKRTLIDLLDPRHGLAGESMPEKIEGLTWGPRRADGSRTLLVTTDNDFRDDVPGWVWVFSVPEAALAGPIGTAGGGTVVAAPAR